MNALAIVESYCDDKMVTSMLLVVASMLDGHVVMQAVMRSVDAACANL